MRMACQPGGESGTGGRERERNSYSRHAVSLSLSRRKLLTLTLTQQGTPPVGWAIGQGDAAPGRDAAAANGRAGSARPLPENNYDVTLDKCNHSE